MRSRPSPTFQSSDIPTGGDGDCISLALRPLEKAGVEAVRRLGDAAVEPHRIKYRHLTRG